MRHAARAWTEEVQHIAEHQSQRMVRTEGEHAQARSHLSRPALERQRASAASDQERLGRLIERGQALLSDGDEEEQLRMIRWLTSASKAPSKRLHRANQTRPPWSRARPKRHLAPGSIARHTLRKEIPAQSRRCFSIQRWTRHHGDSGIGLKSSTIAR